MEKIIDGRHYVFQELEDRIYPFYPSEAICEIGNAVWKRNFTEDVILEKDGIKKGEVYFLQTERINVFIKELYLNKDGYDCFWEHIDFPYNKEYPSYGYCQIIDLQTKTRNRDFDALLVDKNSKKIVEGCFLKTQNQRKDLVYFSKVVKLNGVLYKENFVNNKRSSLDLASIWWTNDTPDNWEEVVEESEMNKNQF
jgi:hypothetical protein